MAGLPPLSSLIFDIGAEDINVIQRAVRKNLSQSNPAALDLTETPVTLNDLKTMDDQELANLYREIYKSYHTNTNFELDMLRCTNNSFTKLPTESKPVFYPSMLILNKSHKTSIQKLSVRFMLKDYENKTPNPEGFPSTLGRKERAWMKRTLENIPAFTRLRTLSLDITYDHSSPKTLEWDHEDNCLWEDYREDLNTCLDRLPKLNCLQVSTVGESKTLVNWLEARYGFAPTIHKCKLDKRCHHFESESTTEETVVYEWKAFWVTFESRANLEFEAEKVDEEDEDEEESYGDYDDGVEVIHITLPSKGPEVEVGEQLGFEERVAILERELFGSVRLDDVGKTEGHFPTNSCVGTTSLWRIDLVLQE